MKKWALLFGLCAVFGFAAVTKLKLGEQPDGSFLVSSGQRVELLGQTVRLQGLRPKDLALSPDGKAVAVLTQGGLIVCDPSGTPSVTAKLSAAPLGVAWAPDGTKLYASLSSGKIGAYSWNGSAVSSLGQFSVSTARENPGTGGLAVGPQGTIYAALSIRNEVVALSPDGQMTSTWKVGACPYNLALSPDGKTVAVANRGGRIVAPNPAQKDPNTGASFQGTGIANADSHGTPVQIDPRTDAALVGTLSLIKVDEAQAGGSEPPTVTVGRQPSGMVFSKDGRTLYVADSDEDSLSIVDAIGGRELKRVPLAPKEDPTFGQIPTSVALSPDGSRIYVTLGGANAVAVLQNSADPKLLGYFPTAWYPIGIAALEDRVVVASAKGIGSRPSSKTTGFYVHDSVGAYQSVDLKDVSDLRAMTRRVAMNNAWMGIPGPRPNRSPLPVPERIGEPSVFTHVVYIVKENLAYDTAMGDFTPGNGDPSLCTFPELVTPNHHALARRFGLLDNFYISGTNSADGHQWVDSSIANGYTEQNYSANERSYPFDGGDPLAFSPAGFLWTQAKAAGKSVRIFGEFVDKPSIVDTINGKQNPSWRRCWEDYKNGKGEIEVRANSSEAQVLDSLDPQFIGFPTNVSDQWRADRFLSQLHEWESSGNMPNLVVMLLPNDHTVGTSPGWPTPRAFVADNDLAVGRVVEGLSHSKFWPQTAVFVAEDDSQTGVDHVDGHRSIAFAISGYSPRGAEVGDLYTHVSIATTIERILGLQPMTRFDRTARPMTACFGDKPDLEPYTAVANQVPLDELTPSPQRASSEEAERLSEECSKMDWSKVDIQNQDIVNRAIWEKEAPRSVGRAGYSIKYPGRKGYWKDDDD